MPNMTVDASAAQSFAVIPATTAKSTNTSSVHQQATVQTCSLELSQNQQKLKPRDVAYASKNECFQMDQGRKLRTGIISKQYGGVAPLEPPEDESGKHDHLNANYARHSKTQEVEK
eukprot:g23680.t1